MTVATSVAFVYLMSLALVPWRAALFLTFAYAFGTSILSVASPYLFEHPASVALISLALLLLVRDRPGGIGVTGLILGLAVLVRPMNVFVAVAAFAYVAHQRRDRLLSFTLWAVAPAVPRHL